MWSQMFWTLLYIIHYTTCQQANSSIQNNIVGKKLLELFKKLHNWTACILSNLNRVGMYCTSNQKISITKLTVV